MPSRLLLSELTIAGFAVLWFFSLYLVWPLLPTDLARISLLAIFIYGIVAGGRSNYNIALLLTVISGVVAINFAVIRGTITIDYATVIAGILVFVAGLLHSYLTSNFHREFVAKWAFLGLLTSQAFSFFNFWPVSLFNRSFLVAVLFYIIWHYLDVSRDSLVTIVAHFVFSALLAMLIIGSIIWVNFPQLMPF